MAICGIIAAMDEEKVEIEKIMNYTQKEKIYDLEFIKGKINNTYVVLVQSGVGKVNAARTTQILIDNFKIDYILNVGSAGSLNDDLNIGDIVIGEKILQHDFDITSFDHPKGYIPNVGIYIESDKKLVDKMKNIIKEIEIDSNSLRIGIISSGDIFCTDFKMKEKIRKKFDADAVEMEGAAIAQVCKLDNIPFLIIRSISDKPNGKNNITFDKFLEMASKRCANIVEKFLV